MRWVKTQGDRRIKTFFALFPVRLWWTYNISEIRWLEVVTVEQEYDYRKGWVTIRFVDEVVKR